MTKIIAGLKRMPPPSTFVAWGALFLLGGSYVIAIGPHFMPDSTAYVYWAERLIAERFDYPALLAQQQASAFITYVLFVTAFAGIILLFGSAWPWALIFANAAAQATVGMLLTRLVYRLTGSGAGAWAALLLFAASWDMLQWSPRVGSDSTFLLCAYAVFLMEARRILVPKARWLPVFAASAAASLYRPTGIVLFPITLWSLLGDHRRSLRSFLRARRGRI